MGSVSTLQLRASWLQTKSTCAGSTRTRPSSLPGSTGYAGDHPAPAKTGAEDEAREGADAPSSFFSLFVSPRPRCRHLTLYDPRPQDSATARHGQLVAFHVTFASEGARKPYSASTPYLEQTSWTSQKRSLSTDGVACGRLLTRWGMTGTRLCECTTRTPSSGCLSLSSGGFSSGSIPSAQSVGAPSPTNMAASCLVGST